MSTASTYFGKVPFHGDFIGLAQPEPVVRTIDEWFQAGMLRIREARPKWQDDFDAIEPLRLVLFDAQLPGPFAGVFWPSRDRTGRRYPFVFGVQVPECPKRSCLPAVPLALDGYFSAVEYVAADDWDNSSLDAMRQRAASLVWNGFRDEPVQELQSGLARSPTAALWRDLPRFAAPARRALLLQDLLGLATARSAPQFVYRIPCRGDSLTVGFWLSLLDVLGAGARTPHLVAWSPPDNSDRTGTLRVLYDALAPRYFEPFFWSGEDHDQGFDVAYAASPSQEEGARAMATFGQAVERSQTLGNLLQAVAAAVPKH